MQHECAVYRVMQCNAIYSRETMKRTRCTGRAQSRSRAPIQLDALLVCVQCTLLILSTVKHCKIVWIIRSVYCPVRTVVRSFVRSVQRSKSPMFIMVEGFFFFTHDHFIFARKTLNAELYRFDGFLRQPAHKPPVSALSHSLALALAVETVSPLVTLQTV